MKRSQKTWVVLSVLLVCAAGAWAQEGEAPPGNLAMTYVVDVLPGHQAAFEEGYKAHLALHAEAGDTWNREAWVVVAGENVGRYYFRSFGHTWASLDDGVDVPDDKEHLNTAVSPHVQNISSMVTEWMMKMSRWPDDAQPPKMAELTVFTIDYAHVDDFFHVAKKIHKMIGEKELPLQYAWGRVAVGGSGMQLTLAIPRSGWADFEPPKPGIWDVAEEVFGKTEAEMLMSMMGKAIVSEENFVVMHRPDLSYVPGE